MKTRMLLLILLGIATASGCANRSWYTRFRRLEMINTEERTVSYGAIACNYVFSRDGDEHKCQMKLDSYEMGPRCLKMEFDLADAELNVLWRGIRAVIVGPGEKKTLEIAIPTGRFPQTTLRIRAWKSESCAHSRFLPRQTN